MVSSKGWKWKNINNNDELQVWKQPSIESYYLVNRWKSQVKKEFLDLGCGLGRHSILFGKNGFNVHCFDISKDAITNTKNWANEEGLIFDYKIGDMLNLPYENEQFDAILCINVISHTDTKGVKNTIKEIKRVLKPDGECYLTLCSKNTWEFKQENWPLLDENTRLRMEEGPEYKVPHFYADYSLIIDLFKDFKILTVKQVVDYYEKNNKEYSSYHYHVLIKK